MQRVENRGTNGERDDIIIDSAWERCRNGLDNLEEFIRNISYSFEHILRVEIGTPNFVQRTFRLNYYINLYQQENTNTIVY